MCYFQELEVLRSKAVQNGAWGVINKPLNMEKMIQMLDRIKPAGILIADDDPDFIRGLKELLEGSGYTVFISRNGREAIERIRSNGVDVLVLDIRMPVLNGLETYLELKNLGYSITTIIVTAYAMEEAAALDKLRSLSITGILTKPFDPEELLRVLESISESE
ncbi:MAG: response regulator [Thermodesulfobacteriota bacterium]|nr:response regulator [Thermodesulfobacteriota bacterium]